MSQRIQLLGGFAAFDGDIELSLPFSAQRVLANLALHGPVVGRHRLAGTLWGDADEDKAAGCLRSALWRIGRACQTLVRADRTSVRLSAEVQVDVPQMRACALSLIEHMPVCTGHSAIASLSGDLLPDWYEDWVLAERERLRQLRLDALEALADHHLELGQPENAARAALEAVGIEPLRERAQVLLIRARIAAGCHLGAVEAYERYARELQAEIGIDPCPQVASLLGSLHRRSPGSSPRTVRRGRASGLVDRLP